jgi:hypothetical protein
MEESIITRRQAVTTVAGAVVLIAGCSSTSNESDTTETNSTDSNQSTTNSESQSVFADYYVDGDEFVVELNEDRESSITEVVLHYNELYEDDHPRQSVEGISVARFDIVPDGKNDPIEGTWTIDAIESGNVIESAEYNAERNLSLDSVGTGTQSKKFENTNGLSDSDIQFSIVNDGDIPATPYTLKFNAPFSDSYEISGANIVLGLEENTEPMLSPGESLEFRFYGVLCFDDTEDAREQTGETVQASIVANHGTTSESWTFPISIKMGDSVEEDGTEGCVVGSEASKRE